MTTEAELVALGAQVMDLARHLYGDDAHFVFAVSVGQADGAALAVIGNHTDDCIRALLTLAVSTVLESDGATLPPLAVH